MEAEALLRSGDIVGARSWLAAELRRRPGDANLRQFFWQLIAVAGEWDKAEQQLGTLMSAEPKAMMLASVYGQAITAMRQRERVVAGTERAVSLVGSEPWVEALLDAQHAHFSTPGGAAAGLDVAMEDAPTTPGSLDGEAFAWIADADPRFGPMLEAVIGSSYGVVPFAALTRIKVTPPVDLRDTVWLQVELETKTGQTSMAFVPVPYPGTIATGDNSLILGRRTDFVTVDGVDVGLGQKLLTTDGPEAGILGARDIRLG